MPSTDTPTPANSLVVTVLDRAHRQWGADIKLAAGRDHRLDMTVIAVNTAALDSLLQALDLVDTSDVRDNPDSYSFDRDEAQQMDQTVTALYQALAKLKRH